MNLGDLWTEISELHLAVDKDEIEERDADLFAAEACARFQRSVQQRHRPDPNEDGGT